MLLAGIYVFTGASLICATAPTLAVLMAARTAQGLGAAVMMAVTVALDTGDPFESRVAVLPLQTA